MNGPPLSYFSSELDDSTIGSARRERRGRNLRAIFSLGGSSREVELSLARLGLRWDEVRCRGIETFEIPTSPDVETFACENASSEGCSLSVRAFELDARVARTSGALVRTFWIPLCEERLTLGYVGRLLTACARSDETGRIRIPSDGSAPTQILAVGSETAWTQESLVTAEKPSPITGKGGSCLSLIDASCPSPIGDCV